MPVRALVVASAILLVLPATAAAKSTAGAGGKIDSALQQLAAADRAGENVATRARRGRIGVTAGGRLSVEVYVVGDVSRAKAALKAAGMDVRATAGDLVGGLIAIDRVDDVAALSTTRSISAAELPVVDAGDVVSQGDAAHRGPAARALGPTGAGVKVGVISDSINQVAGTGSQIGSGVAASQSRGELPASVTVLKDHTGQDDEGRAMAEIIYDEAPGITQMAFASGTGNGAAPGNAANKADSINQLVAAGVKVIADDIAFLSQPFFFDGPVAQAADAAKAAGVAYFASAGNRARQSYEAQTAFGANPSLHDFDPGAGVDSVQLLGSVANTASVTVVLQWDEPWLIGGVETDIDLELVKPDGSPLPAPAPVGGTDPNPTMGIARELVSWTNTSGAAQDVAIRISRFSGERNPFIKTIVNGAGVTEFATSSDAINPDASSALGAISVAAVAHFDAGLNDPEPFSSRGPKTRLFNASGARLTAPEVREKPNIAAADRVATSVTGFTTFAGTSAATPSAAGIAALALSAKPSLSVDALRAIMTSPTVSNDCTLAGRPDNDCGWGFVFADSIVGTALDSTPPDVAAALGGAAPNAAGWSRGDVSATWTVTDAQSPVATKAGCDPVVRNTDGAGDVTCTATSAGGTTAKSVSLRRDVTPPTAPTAIGLAATTYTFFNAPLPSAVGCASTDATSGVASCTVSGYTTQPGSRQLTMTATDVAGNVSTSTLSYTVRRKPSANDLVTLPSARTCRKRPATLRFTLRKTPLGGVKRVRVTFTGLRAVTATRLPATVTIRRIRRSRGTLTVTATFQDGSVSTIKRVYTFKKRCRR